MIVDSLLGEQESVKLGGAEVNQTWRSRSQSNHVEQESVRLRGAEVSQIWRSQSGLEEQVFCQTYSEEQESVRLEGAGVSQTRRSRSQSDLQE